MTRGLMENDGQLTSAFAESIAGWMPRTQRYLVAVSGGRDSVVLLHFLHRVGYDDLVVCHVNHQLRGDDSDEDESFVHEAAKESGYSFESTRIDVRGWAESEKRSIETAARELRYRWLAEMARTLDCPRVVTAHHADDQVETVVMNFFRGCGTRGLAGMAEHSTRTVDGTELELFRPLLPIRREELERYRIEAGLEFREDASNADDFSLRNRVRNHLLPEVERIFERNVTDAILRTASLARSQEAWIAESMGELPRSGDGLSVKALREMEEAQRDRVIWQWLQEEGVRDCGRNEVRKAVAVVLSNGRPAKENLPGDVHVRRRGGILFLEGGRDRS